MTRGARERLAIASLAAIALAAGCEHSATEVVLVIDTDLALPAQADTLSVRIVSASFNQAFELGPGNLAAGYMTLPSFPTSLGILPHAGAADVPFDVTARTDGLEPTDRSAFGDGRALRGGADAPAVHRAAAIVRVCGDAVPELAVFARVR